MFVSDFEESDEELGDMEDWVGDDSDDDEDDDSDGEADEKGNTKAGDKRKRGRVIRTKAKKKREVEVEGEKLALTI